MMLRRELHMVGVFLGIRGVTGRSRNTFFNFVPYLRHKKSESLSVFAPPMEYMCPIASLCVARSRHLPQKMCLAILHMTRSKFLTHDT